MRKCAVIGLSLFITAAIWINSFLDKREVVYNEDTVVMKVENQEIRVSEVMIHFLIWRNMIENKWGTSMWNAKTGTAKNGTPITYEDDVKNDIKEEIQMEKALKQEAQKKGFSLTKEEIKECQKRAEEMIKKFPEEEVLEYGITIDKLTEHYKDAALALELCSNRLKEVEEKYDPDDYIMSTVHSVVFSTMKKDKNGNDVEMDEREKAFVRKKAERAVQELKDGKSFSSIAKKYQVDYHKEKNLLLSFEEESDAGSEISQLQDGQISNLIEMRYGYLIVQMIHKNDEEKSEEIWKSEVGKAKEEKVLQIYEEDYKEDYHIRVEEEVWDMLPLATRNE